MKKKLKKDIKPQKTDRKPKRNTDSLGEVLLKANCDFLYTLSYSDPLVWKELTHSLVISIEYKMKNNNLILRNL